MVFVNQDFWSNISLANDLLYASIFRFWGYENGCIKIFTSEESQNFHLARFLSSMRTTERTKEMTLIIIDPHIADQKPSI
jgi:hypothetical protein